MARREDPKIRSLQLEDSELVFVSVPKRRVELPELSAAEREVVELALAGRTNREIAAFRGVSCRTVANQLRAAYGKLGVASRFELASRR